MIMKKIFFYWDWNTKLFYRISKVFDIIIQKLFSKKYKIAIIGGYHGGNLGDIALGITTKKTAEKLGYSSTLQTIYSLNKLPYPKIKYAILGGGAIGYSDSLKKVMNRYSNNYQKVAVLGVDFNEIKYDENIIEFLKNVAWISCRSETQQTKLVRITGRTDVIVQPDIVFSFESDFCIKQRYSLKTKKLLINLVPLYGSVINGEIKPNDAYKSERPELYENYCQMIESYIKGIRIIVKQHISEGYTIETIPFTQGDVDFSKLALKGLTVKHNKYHSNPTKMLKKMATAEKIFATRYHATVLAAKVGAQIIPLAYAKKNEHLFEDIGVPRIAYLTTDDLAKGIFNFPDSITFSENIISQWEYKCMKHVVECVNTLMKK
jgi:hypothetical protein